MYKINKKKMLLVRLTFCCFFLIQLEVDFFKQQTERNIHRVQINQTNIQIFKYYVKVY